MNGQTFLKWCCWIGLRLVWRVALLPLVSVPWCIDATAADNAIITDGDAADVPAALSIRVIDASDHTPLAGCRVTNGDYAAIAHGVVGRTNADGECTCAARPFAVETIDGTRADYFQDHFWVHCAGYVSQHLGPRNGAKAKADSEALIVPMVRGRELSGCVVRADNSPVSHEPALLVGNTDSDWPVQKEILTDEKGGFSWSEAPQGAVYIVMGVEKNASSPLFEQLDIKNSMARIQVPFMWHGAAKTAGARLLYLRRGSIGLAPPSIWNLQEGTLHMANVLDLWPVPISHAVVSYSGRKARVDFVCISEQDGAPLRGEIPSESHWQGVTRAMRASWRGIRNRITGR